MLLTMKKTIKLKNIDLYYDIQWNYSPLLYITAE